jgi:hypothetical protein
VCNGREPDQSANNTENHLLAHYDTHVFLGKQKVWMKGGREGIADALPHKTQVFRTFLRRSVLRLVGLPAIEEKWCGDLNENGSDCESMSV